MPILIIVCNNYLRVGADVELPDVVDIMKLVVVHSVVVGSRKCFMSADFFVVFRY